MSGDTVKKPIVPKTAETRTWRRPRLIKSPLLRWFLLTGSVIYLWFAFTTIGLDPERIAAGIPRGIEFLRGFIWPDFWTRRADIFTGVIESLSITVVSTVIGVLLAVPVAIGGARNMAHPAVYTICRAIIALTRTFPEVMIAIFFVMVLFSEWLSATVRKAVI